MNTNMTLKKRILSVLLTVIVILSMMPLSAFASAAYADENTGGSAGQPSVSEIPTGEDDLSDTETNTKTEIWCTRKPNSIGRSYNGTTDGSMIRITLWFTTDGTDEIQLEEGTGFTAVKTFDSADTGDHTVNVEITLIGEAAKKYKLKEGEETFTIGGTIDQAVPKLVVSLSSSTCTTVEKILPLLSAEGAPEGAAVTYYYTPTPSSIYYSDLDSLNVEIDETTTISDIDETNTTYYIFARSSETKNYTATSSEAVKLTVSREPQHGHEDVIFEPWDGTGEVPYSADGSACVYLTNNVTRDLTLSGTQQLTLCLNGKKLNGTITAEDGGKLTLCDCKSTGSVSAVTVDGGTLAGSGGTIDTLTIGGTSPSVRLSGGSLGSVINSTGNSLKIGELLEDGYAIRHTDGDFIFRRKSISTGSKFEDNAQPVKDLTVTACLDGEHSGVYSNCSYCGKALAAAVYAAGGTKYFTDLDNAVSYAKSFIETHSVKVASLKLLNDAAVSRTIVLNTQGTVYLDLKEYTLSNTADCSGSIIELTSGNLEIRDAGKVAANGVDGIVVTGGTFTMPSESMITADGEGCAAIRMRGGSLDLSYGSVSSENGAYAVIAEGGSSLKVRKQGTFGNVKITESYNGTVNLLAGTYTGIEVEGDKFPTAGAVLGGCCRFVDADTGETVDGSARKVENVKIVHQHEYNDEGVCKSAECYVRAAAKISGTNDDSLDKFYDYLEEALTVAETHEGCTLTVHSDVIVSDTVTVSEGSFRMEFDSYGRIGNELEDTMPCVLKITGGNIEITGDGCLDANSGATTALIVEGGTVTVHDTVTIRNYFGGTAIEYKSGTLTLKGGRYIKAEGGLMFGLPEGKTYADLLAPGYLFADENGSALSPDKVEELTDVQVVACGEHTWGKDGKCTKCSYPCPHDGGNDREASYFEKAICSVCKAEYGDNIQDTTVPTGEIKIKERTWWQTALNAITFGLFYKEDVKAEITATDDSYSQSGFDVAKHAVKTEYFVSDIAMSKEAVEASVFAEYDGAIDLSNEQQYVIYVRLTDYAGNVAYASTKGFEIDKTAPVIEGLENGGTYIFCGEKTITITDKNIDKVTLDGTEIALGENGQYTLQADSEQHKIIVTDKAENKTTVYIKVYPAHDFDTETDTCRNCGTAAAAKVEIGDISDRFATGDELFAALQDEKYSGATVTLLSDVVCTERTSLKYDLTIEMNGKSLSGQIAVGILSGEVTIRSSAGKSDIAATFGVNAGAHLVMGEGIGEVKTIVVVGKLTVYSGSYGYVHTLIPDTKSDDITLYGGTYGRLELRTLGARDALAKGYRFRDLFYAEAGDKTLSHVTVIPCDHEDIDINNICFACGLKLVASVTANDTTKRFGTFEEAISYAGQNEGCTVKLLQDITIAGTSSMVSHYRLALTEGSYTIDLAGKTLTVGAVEGSYLTVSVECDLTISDSVGGGKIVGETGSEAIEVRKRLTITGGDFTGIYKIEAYGADSLVLEGGRFKMVSSAQSAEAVSPLSYLAEGRAYQLTSGSDKYANESDVVRDTVGAMTTCYIRNVSVVSAPLKFHSQPRDDIYYLTMPNYEKWAVFTFLYSGGYPSKGDITITGERTHGTVVYTNTVKPTRIFQDGINLWDFTTADSGQFRIKLEYNGYVLYSNTFTITMTVCEHPGYYEDYGYKCSQCYCDLAAAIVKDGKTAGYVSFADALAAAQTDENKDCTLKLFADVSGTVAVKSGKFTMDAANFTINGKLNVSKDADLTVSGGTVTENVVCAKGGKLTASGTNFAGAINCVGGGSFSGCKLAGTVSGKSSLTLTACEIAGALSISGFTKAESCTVGGDVTINNGGSLKSYSGTYKNSILLKSGGTLDMAGGTYTGKITAESGSKLTLSGGVYTKIAAVSGAKLTISGGSYAEVGAENNVDFTLSGGEFTNITVNGQHLIDCLAEGKAFEDMNNGFIIDGRVGIAGDVKVVDHTHTCVWKTDTHEKLCGCGYVEATDTEAPVISGIDPDNNHYGSLEFTVTDENDFTVWLDGEEITLVNGKYTMEPDNETHLITATDVAGNTVSFRFGIFKTYHVTLPTGAGYTISSSDGLTVRHGNRFSFIVQVNKGYSRTEDFKVLVNGNKLDELWSDTNNASFVVVDVSEDLVITVEGVADITPPEVEVSIRGNSFKEFLNKITFGLFFKETQEVWVKAEDEGSGVKKVEYLLSETPFTNQDAITGDWTEVRLNAQREAWFDIEPNQKAFIYVRVTDVSDNITVVNTDGVVVYTDAEAITEAMTVTRLDGEDVSFAVSLNGNTVKALYNGNTLIDSDSYTVSENGTITLKDDYLSTLAAGEYTIRVAYNPLGMSFGSGDEPATTAVKLTVKKRQPKIVLADWTIKSYDGDPIDPAKTGPMTETNGAMMWEYKPVGADDSEYTATAPKNAGKYTIRLTTAETDNYEAGEATALFVIVQKEVTVTGTAVEASKVYDGTNSARITSPGTVSGIISRDKAAVSVGRATYTDKNVGTGKTVSFTGFILIGDDAANYTLKAQPASVTADITAKEITINGAAVESSKVYDGTTEANITNAGAPSDNYDGENLTIVAGSAAYDNKNVGTGKKVTFSGFALAGDAAANYKLIAQPTSTTADIIVKEITINGTAVETSRIYDGTTGAKITSAGTPSANYDGDNLTIVAGSAAYDNKNAGTGKTVTFTDFTLSGSAAANYKLTAQPDAVTADITVKEIKIVDTAAEASKVYDGNTDAKVTAAGTFDGLIDGDEVAIVTGKAAYDNKNVGNGKTVVFYDFALSGDDAANYLLAAQPDSTTANITPKELTIADLKVKDKPYDGKNTATIDGTPTLVGVVDGDVLTLVNGTPTFDSVATSKNIPISFTAFTLSGDGVTVGNYTLTQPRGITANIVEYVAVGSEYGVNSHDWINKDFVITAKHGYKLSLTDTVNDEWADTLTASEETASGELTFYVKNTETGAISAAVTENYKIDKTTPTGEVKLNERTAFQAFINKITFGLFFKEDVHVKLTATDDASGVKSVLYYKSDKVLTETEVRAITDWTDNSDFDIAAEDMDQFIIYVRIEDNAGNVTLIGSDGATFDTTAPEIVGVENSKTYYVTKKVAIDDENLESVTLNGESVEDVFTLVGDKDATYVICAVDKAGNVTEYTVYMKPISSITDAIASITVDNVKSSDAETISSVERQILNIAETFDDGESTEDEWNKLTDAAAKCKELNKRIAEVADEITRLTDAVNGYDIGKVTSADKAGIEKLIADIDVLLGSDNLTNAERAALEALKATARTLLDRIAAAKNASEDDEIKAVDGIVGNNVKLEDKEALEKAEKALESALRDFDGNYTEVERKELETKLETVKAMLTAINNAEKAADAIGKLPSADDAKLSDKSELDRVKEIVAGLTDDEKAMLDKDITGKVDALEEKIRRLEEEADKSDSPTTGYTGDLALWIALLFISGGVVTGTTVVSKKKKRSVK